MAPQRSLHPRHVCGKIVSEAPVAQIPAPRWNLQPSVGTWCESQSVLINEHTQKKQLQQSISINRTKIMITQWNNHFDRPRTQSHNRKQSIKSMQSINQSNQCNQSINQSIKQSINPSIDRSIDQSINQSINQSIKQSILNCLISCMFLYILFEKTMLAHTFYKS